VTSIALVSVLFIAFSRWVSFNRIYLELPRLESMAEGRFCSVGVPPAVFLVPMTRQRAGETLALPKPCNAAIRKI
jgi:hypothetical protein